MIDKFSDSIVVGNHKAVKAPLIPQHFGKEPPVRGGRTAVQIIEGCHHRSNALFDGSLVRREILIVHACRAHIDLAIVSAGL